MTEEYANEYNKFNYWKLVAIIFILIGIGVGGYFVYRWTYQDGFNEGFESGSAYVVNYQTQNQKIFLFNQTGSPLELNYQQLFNLLQPQNG